MTEERLIAEMPPTTSESGSIIVVENRPGAQEAVRAVQRTIGKRPRGREHHMRQPDKQSR